jgi:hypothetical protein
MSCNSTRRCFSCRKAKCETPRLQEIFSQVCLTQGVNCLCILTPLNTLIRICIRTYLMMHRQLIFTTSGSPHQMRLHQNSAKLVIDSHHKSIASSTTTARAATTTTSQLHPISVLPPCFPISLEHQPLVQQLLSRPSRRNETAST